MVEFVDESNIDYSHDSEQTLVNLGEELPPLSPIYSLVVNPIRNIGTKSAHDPFVNSQRGRLDIHDSLLLEVKLALQHRKCPTNPPPYPRTPRSAPSPHPPPPPPIPPPKLSNNPPSPKSLPTPPKKPLPHSPRLSQPPINDIHLMNHQLASGDTVRHRDKNPVPPNRNYRRNSSIEDTTLSTKHRSAARRTSPGPPSRRYNGMDGLGDIPEHTLRAPIVRRVSSITDCSDNGMFFRQEMEDFPTPKPRVTQKRSTDLLIQQSHSHHLLPTSTFTARHLSHPPPPPPLMKPKPPIPRNKPILKLSHNNY